MPKVFISYAREDAAIAERIYKDLYKLGIQVWMDQFSLLPGQKWKAEIGKAIRDSDYFLALLSNNSLSKRGYVQKELRDAFDVLGEFPYAEIFLIPARLDNCKPVDPRLSEINWVDLFPSYQNGLNKILKVLAPNSNISEGSSSSNNGGLFHVTEYEVSIALAESQVELPPKPSLSLQSTAEIYLSAPFHSYSNEKQTLKQSGKSCVAPLVNAILTRIVRESQSSFLSQSLVDDDKDGTIRNLTNKFTLSVIIADLINKGHELISEIGIEALSILHNILIIENRQHNTRLIAALLLLEEETPNQKTIEAIAIAKRKQRELLEEKGVLENGVETTLFWIFNYILFKTRTDTKFEANFLKSLRERGFTFEEGLNSIKHDAYNLILENLRLSNSSHLA